MNRKNIVGVQADPKAALIEEQLKNIKHKIVVLSGKGGVGKSTIATNIAVSLANKGKKVGLLDIDFHGPSIPKMVGLEGDFLNGNGETFLPSHYSDNLSVMSIGFMLQNQDDAVIWRGPLKMAAIKQFISDVEWGALDYLIVDSPPGTGDEPLSLLQILGDDSKAVIVTTPQDVSLADVRKSVSFCRKMNVEILGVIENMSGFVCPNCGETIDIFKKGGGENMARDMNIAFLGRIPLDPDIVQSGDSGKPYVEKYRGSVTADIVEEIIQPIIDLA